MSFISPNSTPKPVTGRIIIHDFVTLDMSGESVWCFVGVEPARSEEFLAAIHQPGDLEVDPEKYGQVLAFGKGDQVPEDVRKLVYEKYAVAA